jgi:hypothetical protein
MQHHTQNNAGLLAHTYFLQPLSGDMWPASTADCKKEQQGWAHQTTTNIDKTPLASELASRPQAFLLPHTSLSTAYIW